MKFITSLRALFAMLMLMPLMAMAQLEGGKVYVFMNAANAGKAMAPGSDSKVTITNYKEGVYGTMWYVESKNDAFTLRNLSTGQYLRSSKATSTAWTLVDNTDSNCLMEVFTWGSGITLRMKGDSNMSSFMHYGSGSGTIVGWNTSADATLWTAKEVAMTAEELEKNWEEVAGIKYTTEDFNAWTAALAELFKDKACTQLADAYATYTSAQMMEDANYQLLPAALKNMVLKMTVDGTWDEANVDPSKPHWDAEYAKRLRVQLIEPYCSKEEAASVLHMNAHTNLNNPLGLYANERQTLYIMVEGSIEPGVTLYLNTWTGHGKPGGKTEGYRLVEGLNVIPNFADGMTGCISYVVNAFDGGKRGNKARQMSLKAFKDIKVHMEGGNLNGFFNLMGDELWGEGDDNADWDYYAARATHTAMPMLGQYMTLQFPFFDEDCVDNDGGQNRGLNSYFTGKNIAKQSLVEWDNIMLWERLLMGLASKEEVARANSIWKSPYSDKDEVFSHTGDLTDGYASDYEDYYRVHGLAYGVPNGYMYGSWDHSGYNFNTMEAILVTMINDSGSHWGPAHEIGHQHQEPFTLNGLMEVTNNLFSNVALWYFGKSTSRVNGAEGCLEVVANSFNQKDGDFYTNNIWALTHMYFRLFLYYHVLGHNTEFYPRLYEMMRQNHMERVNEPGIQTGERGLLLFYRMACDAAREDLTEFFRGHGLLTPMNERFVGDYSNSIYTSTPAEIESAIAYVKAKGYKNNVAPLFINDGTGQEAVGPTGRVLEHFDWSGSQKLITANVGHYAYFYEPATNYTFAVASSGAIEMTGEGGIGFVVRNDKGELLAFSNKKKMYVSEEVGLQLIRGEVKIEAVNGDGTFVEVEGDMAASTRTLLKQVLDRANAMFETTENKYNKVGFYRVDYLTELEALIPTIQAIYDEEKVTEYAAAYEQLLSVIEAIDNNPDAVVGIMEGEAYQITTYNNYKKAIEVASSSDRLLTGVKTSSTSKAQRWYFEKAEEEGTYYLKNVMSGTYLDAMTSGEQATALTKTGEKAAFKLLKKGAGVFALQYQGEKKTSVNINPSSSKILGWGDEDNNSWWYITAKTINTSDLEKIELKDLIKRTSNLLHEMGENVILPGNMPLQVNDASARYYLSTNADQNVVGATKLGNGIASVLDGDTYTFLHTQRDGEKVSGYHNLTVDLGEGAELSDFTFKFTTPNYDAGTATPVPSKIRVRGSVDGESYTTITTISSGMPSYTKKGVTWTSDSIKADEPYRYFRYEVMTSTGPGTTSYGRAFFSISEFSMQSLSTVIKSLKENYKGTEALYEETAVELNNAMIVSANSDASSTEVSNALANLQAKYDALHGAYLTDIEGVEVNTNKQQGIYDLFGRRVNQIATPGLYIINGKKQFVK